MSEPGSEWRVRAGVGLLAAGGVPMSDAQREAVARESERERLADEAKANLADELKFESDAERDWWMQRHGLERVSVGDVLERASRAQDRQDRRDAAAEERAAVDLGHQPPRRPSSTALLAAAKADREARNAEAEATPASQAELDRGLKKLANSVSNAIGKLLP